MPQLEEFCLKCGKVTPSVADVADETAVAIVYRCADCGLVGLSVLRKIRTIRLIAIEVDASGAAHIGCPVVFRHKTVDIPCPDELRSWLEKSGTYNQRSITGVEIRYE